MADSNIQIKITADDQASGVLNNVGKSASGLGGVLGTLAKTAGVLLVAGLGAATTEAYRAVEAYDESQKVLVQLDAVLKSTADASGLAKDQIIGQAKAFQQMTTYSDEAVGSAQNLLLTFTAIKGDTFKQATGVILDMATALGEDLKSASIQVGKALQDPILGITALRRVGVNFSDDQKQVIKTMVDTGHAAQAQQFILAELNREFGGSAAAATNTFSGAMKQLANSFNDLEETVGKVLVDALTPFIKSLAEWASKPETQERLKGLIQDFTNFAGTVIEAAGAVERFIAGALQGLLNIWQQLSAYFNSDILPTLHALWDIAENFLGPSFNKLWITLSTQLWPALQQLWAVLAPLLIPALKLTAEILGAALYAAILIVVKVLTELANIFAGVLTTVTQIATFITNVAIGAWKGLNDIINSIADALQKVIDLAARAANAVGSVLPKQNAGASLNPFSSSFQLPHFASGGIVTGPTVAMIGEAGPEAVVPLNRAGGFGGTVINITGTFLSEDAAMSLANILVDRLKMQIKI